MTSRVALQINRVPWTWGKEKTNLRATIVIYFVVPRQGLFLRRPESLGRVTLTARNTFRAR